MQSESVDKERIVAADINYKLGQYLEEREANPQSAIQVYIECLSKNENHVAALIALAKLHQAQNDTKATVEYCKRALKVEQTNEEASFMLANIMLFENKAPAAIQTFRTLLEKQPDNYRALAKLVHLFRRTGKLEDAKEFIEKSEHAAARKCDAGLAYVRGLYERFSGNPQGALKELNTARFDGFYGIDALVLMVEIYLNPHDEIMFSSQEKGLTYTTTPENLRAAESLIEKLQMRNYDTTILECYGMMQTNKKENVEKANQILSEMYKANNQYVPVLNSLSVAKFLLKKSTDARNYLKIVQAKHYQPEFSDEYEKGWLMLADFFIANNKYDLAETLLKKCLQYNQSLVKAEEFMGIIKEKEQMYVDAANHYEKAWRMSNGRNAGVG